jgi:hypothetical protein
MSWTQLYANCIDDFLFAGIQNCVDKPPIWGHSWDQALLKNPFAIHFLGMDQARLRSIGAQASTSPGIGSRKPQRITITVSWSLYQSLLETSDHQGRSLSNTAAYWLERQCERLERKAA